jgi:hypothetical protein
MPAGVPGVPTASAREDRLRPKGRLRQQPAGDSTEEKWSRVMKTKHLYGCLAKSRMAPTRAAGAQDRSDARHDHIQPMRDQRPFPMTGSEAKEKGYDLQMPAQRKKALYKVPLPEQGQRITPRTPPPRSRQPAEPLPKPVTRPPTI